MAMSAERAMSQWFRMLSLCHKPYDVAMSAPRARPPTASMMAAAAGPSGSEVLWRHCGVRERLQDLAVGRDQLDLEIQGRGDELAVIGRAPRSKCEVQDRTGRHA